MPKNSNFSLPLLATVPNERNCSKNFLRDISILFSGKMKFFLKRSWPTSKIKIFKTFFEKIWLFFKNFVEIFLYSFWPKKVMVGLVPKKFWGMFQHYYITKWKIFWKEVDQLHKSRFSKKKLKNLVFFPTFLLKIFFWFFFMRFLAKINYTMAKN